MSTDRGAVVWRLVAVAAGLAVLGQVIGLYLPRPPGEGAFPGVDKLQHAIAFALPVVLVPWADTLRRRTSGRPPRARVLVLVVWLSVAHAVVSELVQHLAFADRDGDPLDVLADWSGIVIGGLVAGFGLVWRRPGRRWEPSGAGRVPADG